MSRIIVLEGADASGKSTLAKKLVEAFKGEYVKFSQPKRPPYDEYMDFLLKHEPTKTYVLDRFMYGEMVYGPLLRGAAGMTMLDLNYLEMVLMRFNHVVIHCNVELGQNLFKLKERGDEFIKLEQLKTIKNGYVKLFKQTLIEPHTYDWTEDDVESFIGKVRGDLMLQEARRSSLLDHLPVGSYVGTSAPRYLFIGDEKNRKLNDKPVFDSKPGRYLLAHLVQLKVADQSAMINSLDEEFGQLNAMHVNRMKARKIICLGEKSFQRIRYGIKVSHPQYAKRFYGKNHHQRYLNELKEAIYS